MEIKPFIAKKPPEYPTEYLFINNPELFKRYIPLRWYKNKLVCTALSVFIVAGGTNSCAIAPKTAIEVSEKSDKSKTPKETQNETIKVAPIFSHGKGSGEVGCMVMSPPVFISESEAKEIIIEAFRKENITIDTVDCPKISFKAEAIADIYFDGVERKEIADVTLTMDCMNKEHNIVIEYISDIDFLKFHSSQGGYDTRFFLDNKKAAKLTREALVKEGKYNAGVFYDPIPKYLDIECFNLEKRYLNTKKEAKNMLESQVQDFIDWLKTEKIIK